MTPFLLPKKNTPFVILLMLALYGQPAFGLATTCPYGHRPGATKDTSANTKIHTTTSVTPISIITNSLTTGSTITGIGFTGHDFSNNKDVLNVNIGNYQHTITLEKDCGSQDKAASALNEYFTADNIAVTAEVFNGNLRLTSSNWRPGNVVTISCNEPGPYGNPVNKLFGMLNCLDENPVPSLVRSSNSYYLANTSLTLQLDGTNITGTWKRLETNARRFTDDVETFTEIPSELLALNEPFNWYFFTEKGNMILKDTDGIEFPIDREFWILSYHETFVRPYGSFVQYRGVGSSNFTVNRPQKYFQQTAIVGGAIGLKQHTTDRRCIDYRSAYELVCTDKVTQPNTKQLGSCAEACRTYVGFEHATNSDGRCDCCGNLEELMDKYEGLYRDPDRPIPREQLQKKYWFDEIQEGNGIVNYPEGIISQRMTISQVAGQNGVYIRRFGYPSSDLFTNIVSGFSGLNLNTTHVGVFRFYDTSVHQSTIQKCANKCHVESSKYFSYEETQLKCQCCTTFEDIALQDPVIAEQHAAIRKFSEQTIYQELTATSFALGKYTSYLANESVISYEGAQDRDGALVEMEPSFFSNIFENFDSRLPFSSRSYKNESWTKAPTLKIFSTETELDNSYDWLDGEDFYDQQLDAIQKTWNVHYKNAIISWSGVGYPAERYATLNGIKMECNTGDTAPSSTLAFGYICVRGKWYTFAEIKTDQLYDGQVDGEPSKKVTQILQEKYALYGGGGVQMVWSVNNPFWSRKTVEPQNVRWWGKNDGIAAAFGVDKYAGSPRATLFGEDWSGEIICCYMVPGSSEAGIDIQTPIFYNRDGEPPVPWEDQPSLVGALESTTDGNSKKLATIQSFMGIHDARKDDGKFPYSGGSQPALTTPKYDIIVDGTRYSIPLWTWETKMNPIEPWKALKLTDPRAEGGLNYQIHDMTHGNYYDVVLQIRWLGLGEVQAEISKLGGAIQASSAFMPSTQHNHELFKYRLQSKGYNSMSTGQQDKFRLAEGMYIPVKDVGGVKDVVQREHMAHPLSWNDAEGFMTSETYTSAHDNEEIKYLKITDEQHTIGARVFPTGTIWYSKSMTRLSSQKDGPGSQIQIPKFKIDGTTPNPWPPKWGPIGVEAISNCGTKFPQNPNYNSGRVDGEPPDMYGGESLPNSKEYWNNIGDTMGSNDNMLKWTCYKCNHDETGNDPLRYPTWVRTEDIKLSGTCGTDLTRFETLVWDPLQTYRDNALDPTKGMNCLDADGHIIPPPANAYPDFACGISFDNCEDKNVWAGGVAGPLASYMIASPDKSYSCDSLGATCNLYKGQRYDRFIYKNWETALIPDYPNDMYVCCRKDNTSNVWTKGVHQRKESGEIIDGCGQWKPVGAATDAPFFNVGNIDDMLVVQTGWTTNSYINVPSIIHFTTEQLTATRSCYPCQAGTFENSTKDCEPCAIGTYRQDITAQTSGETKFKIEWQLTDIGSNRKDGVLTKDDCILLGLEHNSDYVSYSNRPIGTFFEAGDDILHQDQSANIGSCIWGNSSDVGTDQNIRDGWPDSSWPGDRWWESGSATSVFDTYQISGFYPTLCQPGTYNPDRGSPSPTSCKKCPLGFASSERGRGTPCDVCGPGKYAEQIGSTTCKTCNSGTIQPQPQKTSCLDCVAGKSNDPTHQSCVDCALGEGSRYDTDTDGNDYPTSCETCQAGRYEMVNEDNCGRRDGYGACTKNYYADGSICKACPDGKYTLTKTEQNGVQYGIKYAPRYSAEPGTHLNTYNLSSCLSCPMGRPLDPYDTNKGSFTTETLTTFQTCQECNYGMYESQADPGYCSACPTGRYNDDELGLYGPSGTCKTCKSGTEWDSSKVGWSTAAASDGKLKITDFAQASDNCIACPEGTFSIASQSGVQTTVCTPCPDNYVTKGTERTFCFQCPTGTLSENNTCIPQKTTQPPTLSDNYYIIENNIWTKTTASEEEFGLVVPATPSTAHCDSAPEYNDHVVPNGLACTLPDIHWVNNDFIRKHDLGATTYTIGDDILRRTYDFEYPNKHLYHDKYKLVKYDGSQHLTEEYEESDEQGILSNMGSFSMDALENTKWTETHSGKPIESPEECVKAAVSINVFLNKELYLGAQRSANRLTPVLEGFFPHPNFQPISIPDSWDLLSPNSKGNSNHRAGCTFNSVGKLFWNPEDNVNRLTGDETTTQQTCGCPQGTPECTLEFAWDGTHNVCLSTEDCIKVQQDLLNTCSDAKPLCEVGLNNGGVYSECLSRLQCAGVGGTVKERNEVEWRFELTNALEQPLTSGEVVKQGTYEGKIKANTPTGSTVIHVMSRIGQNFDNQNSLTLDGVTVSPNATKDTSVTKTKTTILIIEYIDDLIANNENDCNVKDANGKLLENTGSEPFKKCNFAPTCNVDIFTLYKMDEPIPTVPLDSVVEVGCSHDGVGGGSVSSLDFYAVCALTKYVTEPTLLFYPKYDIGRDPPRLGPDPPVDTDNVNIQQRGTCKISGQDRMDNVPANTEQFKCDLRLATESISGDSRWYDKAAIYHNTNIVDPRAGYSLTANYKLIGENATNNAVDNNDEFVCDIQNNCNIVVVCKDAYDGERVEYSTVYDPPSLLTTVNDFERVWDRITKYNLNAYQLTCGREGWEGRRTQCSKKNPEHFHRELDSNKVNSVVVSVPVKKTVTAPNGGTMQVDLVPNESPLNCDVDGSGNMYNCRNYLGVIFTVNRDTRHTSSFTTKPHSKGNSGSCIPPDWLTYTNSKNYVRVGTIGQDGKPCPQCSAGSSIFWQHRASRPTCCRNDCHQADKNVVDDSSYGYRCACTNEEETDDGYNEKACTTKVECEMQDAAYETKAVTKMFAPNSKSGSRDTGRFWWEDNYQCTSTFTWVVDLDNPNHGHEVGMTYQLSNPDFDVKVTDCTTSSNKINLAQGSATCISSVDYGVGHTIIPPQFMPNPAPRCAIKIYEQNDAMCNEDMVSKETCSGWIDYVKHNSDNFHVPQYKPAISMEVGQVPGFKVAGSNYVEGKWVNGFTTGKTGTWDYERVISFDKNCDTWVMDNNKIRPFLKTWTCDECTNFKVDEQGILACDWDLKCSAPTDAMWKYVPTNLNVNWPVTKWQKERTDAWAIKCGFNFDTYEPLVFVPKAHSPTNPIYNNMDLARLDYGSLDEAWKNYATNWLADPGIFKSSILYTEEHTQICGPKGATCTKPRGWLPTTKCDDVGNAYERCRWMSDVFPGMPKLELTSSSLHRLEHYSNNPSERSANLDMAGHINHKLSSRYKLTGTFAADVDKYWVKVTKMDEITTNKFISVGGIIGSLIPAGSWAYTGQLFKLSVLDGEDFRFCVDKSNTDRCPTEPGSGGGQGFISVADSTDMRRFNLNEIKLPHDSSEHLEWSGVDDKTRVPASPFFTAGSLTTVVKAYLAHFQKRVDKFDRMWHGDSGVGGRRSVNWYQECSTTMGGTARRKWAPSKFRYDDSWLSATLDNNFNATLGLLFDLPAIDWPTTWPFRLSTTKQKELNDRLSAVTALMIPTDIGGKVWKLCDENPYKEYQGGERDDAQHGYDNNGIGKYVLPNQFKIKTLQDGVEFNTHCECLPGSKIITDTKQKIIGGDMRWDYRAGEDISDHYSGFCEQSSCLLVKTANDPCLDDMNVKISTSAACLSSMQQSPNNYELKYGSFADAANGMYYCTKCPVGYDKVYFNTVGAPFICQLRRTCANGITPDPHINHDDCSDCNAGYAFTSKASENINICVACTGRDYNNNAGKIGCNSSCHDDEIGNGRSIGGGNTGCLKCGPGSQQFQHYSCLPCPKGTYKNGTDGLCEMCPLGQYTDTDGSTSCKTCGIGQGGSRINFNGVESIVEIGASGCQDCPHGSYNNKTLGVCEPWTSTRNSCRFSGLNKTPANGTTTTDNACSNDTMRYCHCANGTARSEWCRPAYYEQQNHLHLYKSYRIDSDKVIGAQMLDTSNKNNGDVTDVQVNPGPYNIILDNLDCTKYKELTGFGSSEVQTVNSSIYPTGCVCVKSTNTFYFNIGGYNNKCSTEVSCILKSVDDCDSCNTGFEQARVTYLYPQTYNIGKNLWDAAEDVLRNRQCRLESKLYGWGFLPDAATGVCTKQCIKWKNDLEVSGNTYEVASSYEYDHICNELLSAGHLFTDPSCQLKRRLRSVKHALI
jgi:hypothetical protein